MFGGEASHLPLKINTSGVIPPIFASSLLLLPATIATFQTVNGGQSFGWIGTITAYLAHGTPLYMLLYVGLIIVQRHLLIPRSCSTRPRPADNLRKYGGFHPRHPGPARTTADHL